MNKDVILTVDFADQVHYEDRFCDASYIDEIIGRAAHRNVKAILWRTLAGGCGLYRSKSVPTFEDQSPKWKPLLEAVDPLEAAITSARKHGIKLIAWATLQDFHIVRFSIRGETGESKVVKNTTPFFDENPHLYWLSVNGKRFHAGIPCYGYAEARAYYVDHIKEVMSYGPDGLYVCFRSHALEPDEDDEYGYNEPWRRQLYDETGVDTPTQEIRDNGWLSYRMQKIRGASFTQLLREVREVVGNAPVWVGVAEEPNILIAGSCAKENPTRTMHRARLDVNGWCREGLVDTVIVVTSRMNPGDPTTAQIYRDATQMHGKQLYAWLNLVAFHWQHGSKLKRTPTADELQAIIARGAKHDVDGLVIHEAANLDFNYLRVYLDGKKQKWETRFSPPPDRDAMWDALMG